MKYLSVLIACLSLMGMICLNASETPATPPVPEMLTIQPQPKNGSVTNKSDEIVNIFLFKSPTAAANILLANGWSQKSLTLLANTTKIAQEFVKEAAVVNLGIGFLSDFATDVISSVIAAIGTTAQFLCVSKGVKIVWNIKSLRAKTKNPNLESMFCVIFATQPDWTTNFKKILFMGPLDISTNYEYQLGKMTNKDTGEVYIEFTPIEQTKSGTIKKLTELSPEDIAKEVQSMIQARKERQEEAERKLLQEAEELQREKARKIEAAQQAQRAQIEAAQQAQREAEKKESKRVALELQKEVLKKLTASQQGSSLGRSANPPAQQGPMPVVAPSLMEPNPEASAAAAAPTPAAQ